MRLIILTSRDTIGTPACASPGQMGRVDQTKPHKQKKLKKGFLSALINTQSSKLADEEAETTTISLSRPIFLFFSSLQVSHSRVSYGPYGWCYFLFNELGHGIDAYTIFAELAV